ncbi:sugar diacid recognition domain-containing protein [Marinobacterium sedimentorum]|uniref:sugar diacid recognition domain-containing protein n=1 Tax=Marinobacterium sedimentorum TaxID=2927804 RepID=UPI0020C5BF55|nr:sugar diacid recognition domain-containing protein [Marinobacterium sedimentorum]MCP8687315.1 helix-turn-helix domain-containing protein [Marinobacterium sedimentorum]
MFIDRQMAQKIVDRAMKITGVNVNVMDHHGVIIGSGDPLRIDQLHEGALHVLSSQSEVDIARDQAGRLSGVQGGVNLPIRSDGDIIGVVGITGEPQEVRRYADLVVMTAELIVEQAALTAAVQWDSRQRESVLLRLIEGGRSDSLFDDRVARLQLDLSLPRVVVVLELVQAADGADLPLPQLQQLQQQLTAASAGTLLAITTARQMVMLVPVSLNGADSQRWDKALFRRQLEARLRPLQQHHGVHYRACVGDYFPSAEGLAQSYRSALKAQAVTRGRAMPASLSFATESALDLLLLEAAEGWAGQHLLREFEAFLQQDKNGSLQLTLEAYLAENMDLARTSARLHIHRNTLRYRLDKIGTLLQLDLGSVDQLLQLFVTLRLYGLSQSAG